MDLFLKSRVLDGKASWSSKFNSRIDKSEHREVRTENVYLTPELYKYTDLMKAVTLGSIIVIETDGCDILIYGIPGAPVYMTRINHGKINTVYNIKDHQKIPPHTVKNVYTGTFGKYLIESLVRYNPLCESLTFLIRSGYDCLYNTVVFELVVV